MFFNHITLHIFTDVGIDIRSFDIGADSDVLDLYVELANQDDYKEHPEWLTFRHPETGFILDRKTIVSDIFNSSKVSWNLNVYLESKSYCKCRG